MQLRMAVGGLQTLHATAAAAPRFVPGLKLHQYELIRELGRGGMGQVFLARDIKLARRVAIKFLSSESQELTARFLDEARTTAMVHHENIVVIHDVDEYDGSPHMVLEFLEGSTLRDVIQGHAFAPPRVLELMIPVVRALVRAHEHGIVHRDLKPSNVSVTKRGAVKVL
ncbi:MAG: serine/threonine protein kinase, partial [Deltaproteobacteria bacterium]|nr:serine/threonine protein kinase [Deltaproteobacteria bacterium]